MLLDTHAALWIDSGAPVRAEALAALEARTATDPVYFSAVSAWELGLLVKKGRVTLDLPVMAWIDRFLGLPGVLALPLTIEAGLQSSLLPEPLHADPADRLLVAQARLHDLTLVTRDGPLLAYAALGHCRALAC